MCAISFEDVSSAMSPFDLATRLDRQQPVRFADSGCCAGRLKNGEVVGTSPHDYIDFLCSDSDSLQVAQGLLSWAREWAEFRHTSQTRR